MSLFLMAKEFEAITEGGTVPADVKGLIAATGVQICFGKTRFLMPDFQKVIIHPSLFLSAEVKQFHGSETFIDPEYKRHSCLIFAADRLIHAFDSPKSGYNTTLHEFGNVFKFKFDLDDLVGNLEKDPLFDKKLQVIRGFTVQQALDYTKNPTLSTFGTLIEHFFFNPTAFKSLLPELYQQLCALLNQDPINASNPVIEPIDYDLLLEKKEIF
jgi:MtfA peptidase